VDSPQRAYQMRSLTSVFLSAAFALLLTLGLMLFLSVSRAFASPAVGGLAVAKSVSSAEASSGSTLVYTIHVQNSGGVHTVWMTDTLADDLVYVSDTLTATTGSFGYDTESGVVSWTDELAGEAWIVFSAQVSTGMSVKTITNTAYITGDGELLYDAATTQVSPRAVYLPMVVRQVISYYDSFDSSGSGWPDDYLPVWGNVPQGGQDPYYMIVGYRHRGYAGAGEYLLHTPKIPDELFGQHGWFKGLVALAPYANPYSGAAYCVEAQMRFHNWAPWGATMGLLFAADDIGNQSPSRFFALCFSAGASWESGLTWGLIREDSYVMEPPSYLHYIKTQPCGSSDYGISGVWNDPDTNKGGWNVVRVCRSGSNASVYLNGVYKGTWYMAGLGDPSLTHMGASAGAHEHLPVEARLGYFRVTGY
jgi:uncharacterized repeat protein (TIGR01451 family)